MTDILLIVTLILI